MRKTYKHVWTAIDTVVLTSAQRGLVKKVVVVADGVGPTLVQFRTVAAGPVIFEVSAPTGETATVDFPGDGLAVPVGEEFYVDVGANIQGVLVIWE